ncbi:MAG: ABC transporter substrate-binding protein [Spirochaetes bacterium]|nr:ABC transporter substrate-binding protein [Spirochaetota bacterium]
MKQIMKVLVVLSIAILVFSCKKSDSSEKIKLTVMVNFQSSEAVTAEIENAIKGFMQENPDIKVELIPGSSEYEALMKAKMAANDLPDLWATHGWSVLRYSEYLMPLEDQPWADSLHPAIKPVITDKAGHIYVLPLDVDVAGVAYNKNVVKKAGIDVTKIKTWDDMFAAMDKVKQIGITPVHMGGKDHWTVGNFFDWVAPSIFVTDEKNYKGDELKSGKFDENTWKLAAELMQKLKDNQYLNVDMLTSTYPDSARALAEGSVAFEFYGNYVNIEALTYNPQAELGFFPVPAFYDGDEPTLISGERTTLGIWKDTKYPEEAKLLLQYLAKPEVMSKIATANGIPAGLINVTSDTGKLADSYELWKNVEAYPYFDREFLPSGMWDTMCSTGTGILAGEMSPIEASQKMKADFKVLFSN